MNVFTLLILEFKKLAAKKAILYSVIAALLVPVVYGGILLSPRWGPYDNLSNLPVAVVNNDLGAMSDDQPINVGKELVAKLKAGKALGWKFVDSTQAMKGLESNDYYMVIVLPEDFSERVTTVMDPDPKKLKIEYIQNEGLNFLASQITKTATEKIREELGNTITKSYVTKVVGEVSGGLQKAADGSAKLADGTTQLQNGTNELNHSVTGKMADISKLANGTKELKNGTALLLSKLKQRTGDITRLANGSKELHNGTVALKNGSSQILAGLHKTQEGTKKLHEGLVVRLAPGSAQVADGATKLKDGAQRLVAGLEEYRNANPTVNVGPYYQQILDGAKAISAGLASLETGAIKVADGVKNTAIPGAAALNDGVNKLVAGQTKLNDGVIKLEAGAKQIADGNAKVNSGWGEMTNGVSRLDSGAGQIAAGNSAVNEGWRKLADGTTKLNNGAIKVNDGSEQLATGLKSGAENLKPLNNGKENIEMIASPVELVSDKENEYQYYRDSTAPYIMTLGLFVGILIMSLFINFNKPSEVSGISWFIVKFMNLASLALLQGALLLIVALFIVDVNATNPIGLVFFVSIVSITFSAIVLFLATLGGNIGRFVALAIAVLQLSITGANLPIEMLPETFRNLSQYLPFTYSIAGIKSVISLDSLGQAIMYMGILLTYAAVFALLSVVVYRFKYRDSSSKQEMPVERETRYNYTF